MEPTPTDEQPQAPKATDVTPPQTWQTSQQYVQQRDAALAVEQAQSNSSIWLKIASVIFGCFFALLLLTTFTDFLSIQPPAGSVTEGRDYWAAADPVMGVSLIGAAIFGIITAILAIASKRKGTKTFGIVLLTVVLLQLPGAAFMLLLAPCIFSLSPCYVRGS